jgi:hypothetical protein
MLSILLSQAVLEVVTQLAMQVVVVVLAVCVQVHFP